MVSEVRVARGTVAGTTGRAGQFARRAASFRPSLWGEVTDLLERHPDPIFFGNGAPAAELMPVARLQDMASRVWAEAPGRLGYAEPNGYGPLRALIAERMADRDMLVGINQVLVTNGSQQGIDLVGRLMLDSGDGVVVEGPTYLGAVQAFDSYEATYHVVPMDDEGLDPAALEATLAGSARPPKLLYTIPTFQNPTGKTQGLARRRAILDIARRHGLLVIEDDPYGELRVDGDDIPPMRALDPDVVHLGTFSKTVAPGLRIGWVAGPREIVDRLVAAREAADVHGERTTARIVELAARDFLDGHLEMARAGYLRRRDTLIEALGRHMPDGVRWNVPEGGFFLWLELPDPLDAEALLPRAADHGMTYMPGGWFYPDRRPCHALRLSFSSLPEALFDPGMERLGTAIRQEMSARSG
ncbi:MAG: PLP-dependent aminotransferase family protein [Chloroflexia bacterium]|nr:PLP-dependent aminotransferase family protein [Chloroflexia bacterium]